MAVLMIFIDGVGIGENDENKNPFARFPSPFFPRFTDSGSNIAPFDGLVIPTDPSMEVPGLPQSATGQTALLTGINAAMKMGHHLSGFPSPTLRRVIKAESIFLKLQNMNKVGTFANAFTPEYFERPDRQISATTWSVRASIFPFRMVRRELWQDQAISHDLTNSFLARMGYEVPIRTPERSAEILVDITRSVDYCLFEFILTDLIGHRRDMDWAESELQKLDVFFEVVLDRIDLSRNLVLVTSDHGNFEDLSMATHTQNFVPTIVWGKDREMISGKINKIEDVAEAILAWLRNSEPSL